MKKFLLTFIAVIIIALTGAFWWYESGNRLAQPQTGQFEQIAADAAKTVAKITQTVVAPPPLRATIESPVANLSNAGVLNWTNAARNDNGGLKPLVLNAALNAAAAAKLKDMFAGQYFAHESPTGVGPADLARQAGYHYLAVGENLALGNFENNQILVQAWMDSPGHRANILGKYDEIGIAVGRGTYEGRTTWLAVQEFGRPLSACPQPETGLRAQIDSDRAKLDQLLAQADALNSELDAAKKPRGSDQVDAYNAKVANYNDLVKELNALNAQLQGEITVYNGQVQAANACVVR
ncbi:MAG: CAP domain-containing protein [Patescibacteria group bacterium]|jgi:uncharacterized protein YkwD